MEIYFLIISSSKILISITVLGKQQNSTFPGLKKKVKIAIMSSYGLLLSAGETSHLIITVILEKVIK